MWHIPVEVMRERITDRQMNILSSIIFICHKQTKIFYIAVCGVCSHSGAHFGNSRTGPLQERKQSQIAAFLLALLTKVHLRYF